MVCIFLNWDDDNDNNTCDMNETGSVTNENDVIPVTLSIIPSNTDQGSVKLSTPSGSSKIKLWEAANKDTDVSLPKTWNLATEEMPKKFYVEGIQKSGSEKDVTLRLKYTNTVNGTDKTTEDTVRVTVVRLNLGVAAYRELGCSPHNRGHAGLIYEYTGTRERESIKTETNYLVVQMQSDEDPVIVTSFYQFRHPSGLIYWGTYTNNNITDTLRMKIQKNAYKIIDKDAHGTIHYVLNDVVNSNWDRISVSTVTHLRCDGLVEVCYEDADLYVWGKIVSGNTDYDISYSDAYRNEHNETHQFDIVEWEENLYPATQCGHESGERGTSWDSMFTLEPHLYEPNF